MSVQEIERAITQLSTDDLAALAEWFAGYHQDRWDERIERDLSAGRLDAWLADVEAEVDRGESRPL